MRKTQHDFSHPLESSTSLTGEEGTHFQSFRYVWAPAAAVIFIPAGLHGTGVYKKGKKGKRTGLAGVDS